jgi:hypothetical protein
MDQTPLVETLVEDGQRLVGRLRDEGVGVTAAFWAREDENGPWVLYLATALVGEDGATREAYGRVQQAYRQMPQPFWIQPLQIKVVGPSDPVTKDVLELQRRYPGKRPIRLGETHLGGLSFEEVYIYPSEVTQPVS